MQPNPPAAVTLILDEHLEVRTALLSLEQQVRQAVAQRRRPDFHALRGLLARVGETSARPPYAHRSPLLDGMVRDRCPPLDPVLGRLEANRARCDAAKREIEALLAAWEAGGSLTRRGLRGKLAAYVQDYLGRLEVQATYILPVAQEYLTPQDWEELQAAFSRDLAPH